LYTEPTKPTTSSKKEATMPVSRRRDLRRHHPAPEQTPTPSCGKGRPEGRGTKSPTDGPTNSGTPATRPGLARSCRRRHRLAPPRDFLAP
jgi:hypothetical protein